MLRAIYAPIEAAVHVAPIRVAESVKYLCNVFHAVKLGFANEAGADPGRPWRRCPRGVPPVLRGPRPQYFPGLSATGFAFGGSCLPKDVRSFLSLAVSKHVETPFLGQLLRSNDLIIGIAFDLVMRQGRHKVTLFGLAFKHGTDDLRESPFVILAERLLGKGYDLKIYDRSVQVARLTGSNRSYIDREIPHLENLLLDGVKEAAETCRIAIIGHVDAVDRATLVDSLSDQISSISRG